MFYSIVVIFVSFNTPGLSARPVFLAEAVPGTGEDYPCMSRDPNLKIKGIVVRCEHGGMSLY